MGQGLDTCEDCEQPSNISDIFGSLTLIENTNKSQQTKNVVVHEMPVVIFCGPDGAGKSTQVELLIKYLRSKHFRVKHSWIRALHFFAFFLSNLLVAIGLYRIVFNAQGNSYRIIDLKRIPLLRKMWPYIEIFSMLPLMFFRVIIPSRLGWIVVSERYTIDSIASIAWLIEDPKFPESTLARILLSLTPKGSCIINLDSDYDTILGRRGKITEPEEFIVIQREVYSTFSKRLPMSIINTSSRSIMETQLTIRELVLDQICIKSDKEKLKEALELRHGQRNKAARLGPDY
jgi:thymidylate kinase